MHLQPGQSMELPMTAERAVYVARGAVRAGDTEIPAHTMGIFAKDDGVILEASEESRIAIIGGENVGPRRIEWNFVAASDARLESANSD